MLNLTSQVRPLGEYDPAPFLVRLTEDGADDGPRRRESALIVSSPALDSIPTGFRAYLYRSEPQSAPPNSFLLSPELHYLGEGDVVRIEPQRRRLHALYRRESPSNSLLVTERCDNFCVMCSQPPKAADDSWLVDELLRAIPLFSQETVALGLTGGEPGLLGDRLIDLIRSLRDHLPTTAVHVLSNGRAFADPGFAHRLATVAHPDLMLGIPLYSDLPEEHDFVVQARGAFDETLRGILNLKRNGVRVEIRVVLHKETIGRLPELAEFIARNLTFADHVALMGLELMGFAKTNLEALWADPLDYAASLESAVGTLQRARVPVSVYNHQLCVVTPAVRPFARKSISDWKNMYSTECESCADRSDCGGFFASSSLRRSRGIRSISRGATE